MFIFEDIYETLIGNREQAEDVLWVENINTEGSAYAAALQEVSEAYQRLRFRLGIDSCWEITDDDVEALLDAMLVMQREVAWGMFNSGIEYQKRISD